MIGVQSTSNSFHHRQHFLVAEVPLTLVQTWVAALKK
jgi:hypothetical protein